MKIAYIAIKGLPMSGGIEKYTDDMASMLAKKGHDVTVYTTKHYGNKTGSFNGYKIIALPSWKMKTFEKITLVFHASIHQIFQKYDIVHYHALGPSIFAFFAKLSGKGVVIQSHGIEYKRSKWNKLSRFCLKIMEKASYNQGHALTVVSKNLQNYFLECYQKESVFIPTAVNLPPELPNDLSAFHNFHLEKNNYFLFMARIVREKGLHYLIPAYKLRKFSKKLVIAGQLDENDTYHKEIINLAKGCQNILFVGEVLNDKKDQLLRNAYAFVLPSELEGLSVAILEAMSYKKCCIVSDIPENLESCYGHCIAFKSKDIISLADALLYAEKNEEIVEKNGTLGFDYVSKNHQLSTITDQMESLYIDVLNKKCRRKKDEV